LLFESTQISEITVLTCGLNSANGRREPAGHHGADAPRSPISPALLFLGQSLPCFGQYIRQFHRDAPAGLALVSGFHEGEDLDCFIRADGWLTAPEVFGDLNCYHGSAGTAVAPHLPALLQWISAMPFQPFPHAAGD